MTNHIRYLLIGPPLPTQQLAQERLNKIRALATFSPDALSSIAYANQEIYLGLLVAGSAGLALAWPIALVIAGLLSLVALSYFQTIAAYPSGGGSYTVARENLGTLPGLVAAAALMVGYVLTAAVSLTAAVAALASVFPALWPYRVAASLLLLASITLLNLRGLRETGTLMSVPVYLFLFVFLALLAYGLGSLFVEGRVPLPATAPPAQAEVNLSLLLGTFSAGCTALTGIEAISNGVPVFRLPEVRNAQRTLVVMALLMGVLFLGSVGLTQSLAVIARPEETILSALARRIVGGGLAHFLIQLATMLILTVAANTSFAGFPRLASLLAKDGFLPHQLAGLGDRLVFANGILVLAIASGALVIIFGADTHALVPLFAVGVFLAFTLSQAGMVVHWWRQRSRGWWLKAAINGVGALATGVAVAVIGASRFLAGAWITVLVIPLMVMALLRIRDHYREVARQLSMQGVVLPNPSVKAPRVVIPISGVHRGIVDALDYARTISTDVTAAYVEVEPGSGERIRAKWEQWWPGVPLEILPSPYRSTVGPLLDYLDRTDAEHDDGQLATVVLPEFVPGRWWHGFLHNQTAWLIKAALLYRRRHRGFQRVIVDVPYHLAR